MVRPPKPPRFSIFEIAVLSSLYRLEQRSAATLSGVRELLNDGPNDQSLNQKLGELAEQLDTGSNSLKAAIDAANQPTQP